MSTKRQKLIESLESRIPGAVIDFTEGEKFGRALKTKYRPIERVESLCFHQTAFYTENMERILKLAPKIPAHVIITPMGDVILNFEPTVRCNHGNGANSFSIGVEIIARAAGIEGDLKTFWRPKSKPELMPQEATDKALECIHPLAMYYESLCPNLDSICAHRQYSRSRRSDPGSRIWKTAHVASRSQGWTVRKASWKGRKIPTIWGGERGVKY